MFGAKKKKEDGNAGKVMQESQRGNMDEFEALRTVIAENPGLLNRVLEKIRVHRTLSGLDKKQAGAAEAGGLKAEAKADKGPTREAKREK